MLYTGKCQTIFAENKKSLVKGFKIGKGTFSTVSVVMLTFVMFVNPLFFLILSGLK
jgi:hypothetical protein